MHDFDKQETSQATPMSDELGLWTLATDSTANSVIGPSSTASG